MISTRTSLLAAIVLSFVVSPSHSFGDSPVSEESSATLTFPNEQSEDDWKLRSFWPMDMTYGWDVPNLSDGSYQLVVRYGSPRKSPLSAKEGRKERRFEKSFEIGEQEGKGERKGYLSIQLVDLSGIGVTTTEYPARARVVLSLKGKSGSVRIPLSAGVLGSSVSQSPVSNPNWKNDELHFLGFTAKQPKTGLAIRYDVFLVRGPSKTKKPDVSERTRTLSFP